MTRREQWISFYTAALTGSAASPYDPDAIDVVAADIADAAMARLDARDFPEAKAEALQTAARDVWRSAQHKGDSATVPAHLLAALGKALASLNDGSASPETEQS